MSTKEIKINLEELDTQIKNLNSAIDRLKPYSDSFVTETMSIFESFNSDFISKVNDVIKNLSNDTAKNIIEKAEDIHNQSKSICDDFKEADNSLKDSMGG